jgi:2-furoyl-CoA dehydrogenase 2Fe-2S iron sulfur subunit
MPRLTADRRHQVRFILNGRPVSVEVEPRTLLHDALRHGLGATGTHVGCEHGVCGACTIQIDGEPARSCIVLAVQIEGADLRTVECLAPAPGQLSVLQECFREFHALQCGFCMPGILMSLDALFRIRPDATEQEIRATLAGHLCRCTGYVQIMRAALAAQARLREGAGKGRAESPPPFEGGGRGEGSGRPRLGSSHGTNPSPQPPPSRGGGESAPDPRHYPPNTNDA